MLKRRIAKSGIVLLLVLSLMLGVSASAYMGEPDFIANWYNDYCSKMPNADGFKMYLEDAEYGSYLNAGQDMGLTVGDWGISMYVLPSSGEGDRPIQYLCDVLEQIEPSRLSGFSNWARALSDGATFDCEIFNATFTITSTEVVDGIFSLRIEYI